jgi:hypothetical protein
MLHSGHADYVISKAALNCMNARSLARPNWPPRWASPVYRSVGLARTPQTEVARFYGTVWRLC